MLLKDIDKLFAGCRVRIISCCNPWNSYAENIGTIEIVTKVRYDFEAVLIINGNCLDIEDIVMIED